MFNAHFTNARDHRLLHLVAGFVRIIYIFKFNKCESAKAGFDPSHLAHFAKCLLQECWTGRAFDATDEERCTYHRHIAMHPLSTHALNRKLTYSNVLFAQATGI